LKSFFKNINNWQDFTDKLSNLGSKQKGDAFEHLCLLFFKIEPLYRDLYTDVWIGKKAPQKVLDYLGLTNEDIGIDILAKDKNGKYHAIQCKYHTDKSNNVTFKKVSTFLALYQGIPRLQASVICATTLDSSRHYKSLNFSKPTQLLLIDTWASLEKDFFDKVRKHLNNKVVKEKPYKPRKHQEKAIKEAKKHFIKDGNDRGKLIFPCGAGKSLTGYWLTQELDSKSTIIAVPSLSLVKQTLEVYLREVVANKVNVKWLCICSDEDIGKEQDIVIHTEFVGVPCETDPEYIRSWLKTNKNEHKIVFTTYQSGHLIADISKKLKISFDVGIFDEAHKTVGSKLKRFSHLLFEENISIKKRIFMTATERFYSGSKDDIISMNDSDVYGETFSYMTFKEAIESKPPLLTDYKIITIDIKKSEISDFIKENNLVQLNGKWKKETEARSLASMLALRKAMKRFDIKNVVSFHSSIEKAKRNKELQQYITDTYNYKPIDTYTVSGKIPTTKRNVIVQEFAKSDRALITNARCLTEGIDVPNIDCIVFADPRKSKVDIVQALGRALRKKDGKEWGYVILPVVYDSDTNEIDNDNFNEIVSIVRGLAANDERIIEYFKEKSKKGKGSSDMIKGSDVFSLDSSMLEEKDLIGHLQIKLWEKLSRFQWMPFEEARELVRGFGFKKQDEFFKYLRSEDIDINIPYNPARVYENKGWLSWGDFLGTKIGWIPGNWLPFEEAREFIRTFGFKKQTDFIKYIRSKNRRKDIPVKVKRVYKDKGWLSWGDFLGYQIGWDGEYLNFRDARKFVRNLGLNSIAEWDAYCKSGEKPFYIPNSGYNTYKDSGWISTADWLGHDRVAPQNRTYRDFKKARKFTRELRLRTQKEWFLFCKSGNKPQDISSNPQLTYKNKGWISWGDWLGTGKIASHKMEFMTYEEATKYVSKLNINTLKEWSEYWKQNERPAELPSTPQSTYKNKGWESWGKFLGTGRVSDNLKKYRSFKESRKFARNLGLKSQNEWFEYCESGKKPKDIPRRVNSSSHYIKEWKGWGDFLGYDYFQKEKSWSFKKAKKFVCNLGFKNQNEWFEYCKSGKKPNEIPVGVHNFYKDEWKGWGDFLGTGYIANTRRIFHSFNESKKIISDKKFKNRDEYQKFSKIFNESNDIGLNQNPHRKYKDEWKGWGDFLGTGRKRGRSFLSFDEAIRITKKLGIKDYKEWKEYVASVERNTNIPSDPRRYYAKNWKGWRDFLGND
jgi:superfamily II DNA or RNA helicase